MKIATLTSVSSTPRAAAQATSCLPARDVLIGIATPSSARLQSKYRRLFGVILCLAVLFSLFPGCSSYDSRLNSTQTQYLGVGGTVITKSYSPSEMERESYWDGDSATGAPSIVIKISEQKVYYYKGGKLVGVSACSTGREGHNSPIGTFKIRIKDKDHASNLYGDFVDASGVVVVHNVAVQTDKPPAGAHFQGSPMPWFMGFAPGVGMHTGFLPGVPDSHGCIRLLDRMAKIFFAVTPIGTPVTVEP